MPVDSAGLLTLVLILASWNRREWPHQDIHAAQLYCVILKCWRTGADRAWRHMRRITCAGVPLANKIAFERRKNIAEIPVAAGRLVPAQLDAGE